MKKNFVLLLATVFMLSFFSISVAAETTTLSVETPVAMTLVNEEEGNYEYKVTANVTISAANKEVSILMFGNRDNSAFVTGDNVLNLTVEEIASNYNVYYVNQDTADANGKASFVFNVTLPTPAKTDAYYIRVGAMDAGAAEDLGLESLSVNSQIVAVTLTSDKTEYTSKESAQFTATAENVFGNPVDTDFTFTVTQNGTTLENAVNSNGVMSCFGFSGNYVISATATGSSVTSAPLSISVTGSSVSILPGDIDGNGKIAVTDAVAVLRHVARTSPLSGTALEAADFNGDTKVDINDVTAMLKYIARI